MTPMTELVEILREGACLVGLGNPYRRDDGVGPWIAEAVRPAAVRSPLRVFNVEDVLENFVFRIAGADCRNVVIVDAAAGGGEPGTVVFGPLGDFSASGCVSTHKPALELSGKILESAGKSVFLLGIVPEDLGFGPGLTPKVQESAVRLRDLFLRAAGQAGEENAHES
ncbi:MAG: hydrogenase maturation protease [Candidatus Aminicenantes bacterium]|nr:hydrogenase maturation protease [Candidatus Aminicenantes bacterium]